MLYEGEMEGDDDDASLSYLLLWVIQRARVCDLQYFWLLLTGCVQYYTFTGSHQCVLLTGSFRC